MAAIRGGNDGDRSGDVRSPKRKRYPFLYEDDEDEEDDEDFEPASITEDTEPETDPEEDEVLEELGEDVSGTRMATIDNDFEDLAREEQSESPKSSQSAKLQSTEVLDCPTCCEPLKKPIYQCKNGHIACSSCCKKLNKTCSFCRAHIGDIRCRAMEKVIEAAIVPCPNEKYGCKVTTMYCDQSSHEKVCLFVRCSCPVPNCDYVGSYKNLKSHASDVHPWDEGVVFVIDRPLMFNMDLDKYKTVVLKEEKEGDLIVVQAFKGSKGVYVTVKRIAPMTPSLRDFSCSLAKLNQYSTLRIGMMVKKIQKVREQMHPEDNVMWIPPNMLSNSYWKMQICIGYGYKYIHI